MRLRPWLPHRAVRPSLGAFSGLALKEPQRIANQRAGPSYAPACSCLTAPHRSQRRPCMGRRRPTVRVEPESPTFRPGAKSSPFRPANPRPAKLALGATRTEHRHLGWVVIPRVVREIGAPATANGALAPAFDAAKNHSLDLTPSVSAAAARSAIRASPPFIAWAAATPIIDVSVM